MGDSTVHLRGGLVVSAEAVRLLNDLERRDVKIEITRSSALRPQPAALLTDRDREGLLKHRRELVALIRYIDRLKFYDHGRAVDRR